MTIDEFIVADSSESWAAAGFAVDDDAICRIGSVRIRLVGRDHGKGIVGWSLRDAPSVSDVDGVPTSTSVASFAVGAVHPNGVTQLDHAVLMTPDLDRTVAALVALDLDVRRERDGELNGTAIRQVFFKLDAVVLEVVGSPGVRGEGPATFWGLTHTVADIDDTAGLLGAKVGRVKDAVQPGRRIATLRHRDVGMSVHTAFISARH